MHRPKWLIIARNEYRTTINSLGKFRPYFPFLMIIVLTAYVGYITPTIIGIYTNEVQAFFISVAAVAIVELILFMFFFYFLIFPITVALKDMRTEELEIFLSAPVKPSDVLLGTFMGQMPFYAIGVVLVSGVFSAMMSPLGIDYLQMAIIVFIFIITLLSGVWIGTIIAAVIRTRLGKTNRGKDIGKALSLVIALPMVAIMYALMGGGLFDALADPGASSNARLILGFLPSSWGAELIVEFAKNPARTEDILFMTITRFGGLILFFTGSLWIGTKTADRAFDLEITTFSTSTAKSDGGFYIFIRRAVGGGPFGNLLVSIFKDYGRRFENLSKLVYIIGLMTLIIIFIAKPGEPFDLLVYSQFAFALMAGLVVGEVTLRGKEALFIFRKAPGGIDRLISARLIHGWMVTVPIGVLIIFISMMKFKDISFGMLAGIVMMETAMVLAFVTMALGIALLMPAYKEKESFVTPIVISMICMMVFLFSLIALHEIWGVVASLATFWVLGIVLLILGKQNLTRIE